MTIKDNVLIVIPSFYPATIYGGPIFSTLHTCNKLKEIDINVFVSSTNANGDKRLDVVANEFLYDLGFPVKYYNESLIGRISFPLMFSIWKDISIAKVVHIQSIFSMPTPIALFYCLLLKRKVVLSPRGSLGGWCLDKKSIIKKLWLNILIKPFLKHVTWHATSEQEKIEIFDIFGSRKVRIIPNGIDFEALSISRINYYYFLEKYGVCSPSRIIISMGRLEKKKGFDILIKSIAKIISDGGDVKLFIAGPDYGELANLIRLCQSLGIENKVTFVGKIDGDEKIDFLGAADVFAMPSHNENFGNVYAESLACGTPIVASTNTPWQEVEQYKCGKWVSNTVDATASAITEILDGDRATLQKNSKQYIKKFSWQNVAHEFKKLYQELY